uniref:Uncharacterized protein n=1 Tax=Bactrocera dorsalis TaxID=27457 RepID=A0A034WIZ3_BACDO
MSSLHIFYISFFSCALLLHTAFTYNINSSLEYCDYLNKRVFKQRCIGLYTATMLAKYMDGKMRHLNQFAIYAAEDDPGIYFLALRKSVMHFCHRLQWKNNTEFECLDREKPERILLLKAEIHCFKFPLDYCIDLVQLCEVENHRKPVFPEIKENAILYAMRSILAEAGAAFIQPFTKLQLFGILAFVNCAHKLLENI